MTDDTGASPQSPGRWRRWAFEAAIFLLALFAIQAWQTRDAPTGQAPHFASQQVDGQPFDLSRWRASHPGQAGLIYFWASWCGICKTTAGSVGDVAADWPVIGVAIQSGPGDQVATAMHEHQYAWPSIADPDGEVLRQYGFHGVPAFVIIDPDGNIASLSSGYTSELGLRLRLWWATRTSL